MNERINELVLKARGQATSDTKDGGKCFDLDLFHEKFAELIIRECLEVALAQKQWVEEQDVFSERDRDWNKARIQQSQRIVDKVREHFGVQ